MEQKKNEQKTAQILYMTIIMVLLIMAVVVGLVTAAGKRSKPEATTAGTTASTPAAVTTSRVTQLPGVSQTQRPVTTAQTTAKTQVPTAASTKTVAEVEAPVASLPDFIMPTIGSVSKTFSVDALVYSNTMEDYRTHNGIDICATIGEGVMAAADGIVTEVSVDPLMGNTVVIAHDGDAVTVYQNLGDEIPVAVGDKVSSGEVIGAVGDSAMIEIAEEPHLHFEMQVDGALVNPLDFIAAATMTVIYEE